MDDLTVKGGNIVTEDGIISADIVIEEGRIKDITKTTIRGEGRVLNAEGKIVIPGVIDPHVHYYEPYEGWTTGTMSAVGGGITTVIEHPFSEPMTLDIDTLDHKINRACRMSLIDFSLHAMATMENIDEYGELIAAGAVSLKVWMAEAFPDLGIYSLNDRELLEIFTAIGESGGLACVHAELREIVEPSMQGLINEGKTKPEYFLESRPISAELEAVRKVLSLTEKANCPVYFVHVSSGSAMEIISEAKNHRHDIFAETCPQYLLLNRGDFKAQGPMVKFIPPVRVQREVDGLWEYMNADTVDCLGSDHAPTNTTEREVGWEDIWQVRVGIPGLETMLPLILNEVSNERMSIEQVVRTMCLNPAKIMGLYPRKGTIKVGSDADLVLLDMKKEVVITADELHSKCDYTPYEGWEVRGVPEVVISRGEVVMENGYPGEIIGRKGRGEYIPRTLQGPLY